MEPPPNAPSSVEAKRRRRMGGKSTTLGATDMGPIAGYMSLKEEADNLHRAGVAYCLADERNIIPMLNNYLSGSAAHEHEDEDGDKYALKNIGIYNEHRDIFSTSPTGTQLVHLNKEPTLNLYISLSHQGYEQK